MQDIKKLLRLFEDGAIFTAFDTETTGLYPARDRVIEIGAVRFSKDGVQEQFSQLINPEKPMPYMAMKVNGITDSMLCNQPLFPAVYPKFADFLKSSILIAHNTRFDVSLLILNLKKPICRSLSLLMFRPMTQSGWHKSVIRILESLIFNTLHRY